MVRCSIQSITLILLLAVFVSCSKEQDTSDPEIVFILPSENALITENQITVRFQVRDDRQITSVRLALVNADHLPILPSVWFYPSAIDTIIEFDFEWTTQLAAGTYYLQVLVNDGHNEKFKYSKVTIDIVHANVPVLYFVTEVPGRSELWRLDSDLHSAMKIFTSPIDIVQFENNHNNGMTYLITEKPSRLLAIAENGQVIWERDAGMPAAEFTHFAMQANNLLVADASGTLSLINATTGRGLLHVFHQPDTIPRYVFFDDEYLYAIQQIMPGGHFILSLYYKPTAVFYKRFSLNGAIIGIFGYNENKIVIASQSHTGRLIFKAWDKQSEQFESLGELSLQGIKRLRYHGDQNFLAISGQGVGMINPVSGSLTSILQGSGYHDAVWDPFNSDIITARDHTITASSASFQAADPVVMLGLGIRMGN